MAQIDLQWQTVDNLMIALLDEQIKWVGGAIECDHSRDVMDPKHAKKLLKAMIKLREMLDEHYYISH